MQKLGRLWLSMILREAMPFDLGVISSSSHNRSARLTKSVEERKRTSRRRNVLGCLQQLFELLKACAVDGSPLRIVRS